MKYTAPARQRRSAATEMRRASLLLRAIATALRCSLAEIQRVLTAGVQGSPGLSDFEGAAAPSPENADPPASRSDFPMSCSRGVLTPTLSGSRAVVSAEGDDDEHVPTARSAEPSTSVVCDRGRGVRGKPTRLNRRSRISSAASARSLRSCVNRSGRRNRSRSFAIV